MSGARPVDRRIHRRLTMGSAARLIFEGRDSVPAECVDLSVGGMTLRAAYVPGEGEMLTVEVPAPSGSLGRPPLVARLEVRRCHQVAPAVYEIGGAIVEIMS